MSRGRGHPASRKVHEKMADTCTDTVKCLPPASAPHTVQKKKRKTDLMLTLSPHVFQSTRALSSGTAWNATCTSAGACSIRRGGGAADPHIAGGRRYAPPVSRRMPARFM